MPEAGFTGFHSFADGTPRGHAPTALSEPPPAAAWAEVPAYRGGDRLEIPADWRRLAITAGLAAALAAVTTYSWTLLQRPDPAPTPGPQVVLTEPPPPAPVPAPRDRLEVLPSTSPSSTPPSAAPPAAASSAQAPRAAPHRVGRVAPTSEPAAPAAQPAARAGWRPAPAPRNAFDNCRDAPTAAQRMVCGDMRVAAADQRMKEAYAAAMAAGVPYRRLARDQNTWLRERELAARVSRRAVLTAYGERTRDLWAQARARD